MNDDHLLRVEERERLGRPVTVAAADTMRCTLAESHPSRGGARRRTASTCFCCIGSNPRGGLRCRQSKQCRCSAIGERSYRTGHWTHVAEAKRAPASNRARHAAPSYAQCRIGPTCCQSKQCHYPADNEWLWCTEYRTHMPPKRSNALSAANQAGAYELHYGDSRAAEMVLHAAKASKCHTIRVTSFTPTGEKWPAVPASDKNRRCLRRQDSIAEAELIK